MTILVYDGSFAGFLTAIFEVYEYKMPAPVISREESTGGTLFGVRHAVFTSTDKSARVQQKISEKLTPNGFRQFYSSWLSELKETDNALLRYVQYLLLSPKSIENDFSHADVLFVQQTSRKVHREKHRMEAFVRFQLTKDKLYYALIQPDYNVLPLICRHFKTRYADQRWLIYDGLRRYGLYYDGNHVEEIQMTFALDQNNPDAKLALYDEKEELYQQLWKQYFSSVNIEARKNLKLHIQHMPKRYWRYLVEKQ